MGLAAFRLKIAGLPSSAFALDKGTPDLDGTDLPWCHDLVDWKDHYRPSRISGEPQLSKARGSLLGYPSLAFVVGPSLRPIVQKPLPAFLGGLRFQFCHVT